MAGQLRAIVYSRVSTDAQERDGTSLDTQEQASQEFVSESSWMFLESIRDTARGSSPVPPTIYSRLESPLDIARHFGK